MKLILLQCPTCGEALKPDNDDVVIACTNCHTPVAISTNGPVKMKVQFALGPGTTDSDSSVWMPFWIFEGQVHILVRETQGGKKVAREQSATFWGSSRRLYVPAWDVDMAMAQEIGSRLIEWQPVFKPIEQPLKAHLSSATITPKDASKMLEFIILAIEARRDDWLKDLKFELDVGEPELWAIPEGDYR